MSQISETVNETIEVTLKLKVTLTMLSNHNGFKEGQLQSAIDEFKENIEEHLTEKIVNEYHQESDVIYGADFVYYNVEKI
jgi:hypothetical protein